MFALTELEVEALLLSLRVGFWSVLVSLPLGIVVAMVLARGRFPGKSLLDAVVHFPLVVPPVAVGYLLLVLLGRRGPVGGWLYDSFGVTVIFTWQGAVIASAVMAFPLMVRAIRLSIEGLDRRLETAARTLGATPVDVFLTITLPLIAPGVLTGVVLAFARSIGEFGATITFVSNIVGETRTLPLALYTLTQAPGGEASAARLLTISIVLALVAVIASEFLTRRVARRIGGEG